MIRSIKSKLWIERRMPLWGIADKHNVFKAIELAEEDARERAINTFCRRSEDEHYCWGSCEFFNRGYISKRMKDCAARNYFVEEYDK